MKRLEKFFLGLAVSLLLSLPCFAEGGSVTLTASEFQTLKIALQTADEQLTKSENEIVSLKERLKESQELVTNLQIKSENLLLLLNEQEKDLGTLTMQLDTALKSLKKLKNETTTNNVILIIIGAVGIVLGGSLVFLLIGGR